MVVCLNILIFITAISPVYAASNKYDTQIYEINGIEYETVIEDSDNYLYVTTSSNLGEIDRFIYDKSTNKSTLNGETLDLSVTCETNNYNYQIESLANIESTTSNWTPVYMATYKITYSEMVTSISAILTVITGTISMASLTGLVLPSIYTPIANWLSVIGMGTTFASTLLTGGFSFKLYRTSGPVSFPGYSYPLIVYRYQNACVSMNMRNSKFSYDWANIGNWWSDQKPC